MVAVALIALGEGSPSSGTALLMAVPAKLDPWEVDVGGQPALRNCAVTGGTSHKAMCFVVKLSIREPACGNDRSYRRGQTFATTFRRLVTDFAVLGPEKPFRFRGALPHPFGRR